MFTFFCTPPESPPHSVCFDSILQASLLSFILSLSITLPLQPLTMFHQKIQFWPLATHCTLSCLHIDPFDLPLPCALPSQHVCYPVNDAPCILLRLPLLVLHLCAISAASVSHKDICSIAPSSLPCLKALLFQWFTDPGTITVAAEGLEELLLS